MYTHTKLMITYARYRPCSPCQSSEDNGKTQNNPAFTKIVSRQNVGQYTPEEEKVFFAFCFFF